MLAVGWMLAMGGAPAARHIRIARPACWLWMLAMIVDAVASATGTAAQIPTPVRCEVVDADTGQPLPVRVYARAADGRWLFAHSAAPDGSAVVYDKQRFENCVERHATVSAHPFVIDAPRGALTVRIERGKEYLPAEKVVHVGQKPLAIRFELKRWIDMAAAGWYSGDTHVHRPLAELPNLLLAEDLNVGLPLSYWVTTAYTAPGSGQSKEAMRVEPEPIYVDPTHVIYPVNTEYEIFTVAGKRHTLGAVFALGHREPFSFGVPPVRPFAEEARRQGAILDLDKHSWPWSFMLVPVAGVELFELANNHCWRTAFGFRRWSADKLPAFMKLERDKRGLTEWGWIDFGFQTYYALLNCGFRMKPSAGTASGVHPVPLGFGRVYVHVPDTFRYESWMRALAAGRSFVTTGPMVTAEVEGQAPGSVIRLPAGGGSVHVTGTAASCQPLRPIEVVTGGKVVARVPAANRKTERGAYESPIDVRVPVRRSSWIALRVFEDRPDGRIRFAHTSPVHVEVPGQPLRPRRVEVEYLIRRMREEIRRNRSVLRPPELEEYEQALEAFERLAGSSRE